MYIYIHNNGNVFMLVMCTKDTYVYDVHFLPVTMWKRNDKTVYGAYSGG